MESPGSKKKMFNCPSCLRVKLDRQGSWGEEEIEEYSVDITTAFCSNSGWET